MFLVIVMDLFEQFDCCGPEDYTDFNGKGTWKSADGDGANVITPTACCKSLPGNNAGVATCAGDASKTISDIASLNNYNKVSFIIH